MLIRDYFLELRDKIFFHVLFFDGELLLDAIDQGGRVARQVTVFSDTVQAVNLLYREVSANLHEAFIATGDSLLVAFVKDVARALQDRSLLLVTDYGALLNELVNCGLLCMALVN